MNSQQTATINFDAQVQLERRGDYWAAYIEPPGATVYGDTEAEARERVGEALDFFVASLVGEIGLERFRRYLDGHGVKNSVVVPNRSDQSGQIRQILPVSFPVEVAAVA